MQPLKSRVISSTGSTTRAKSRSTDDGQTEPLISSLRLQACCIVTTLLAGVIFTLTEHDDHQHTWWCAFEIFMQVLLVFVGTAYFRKRVRVFHDTSLLMPPLVMVAAFSLVCEPVQRLFFETGHSFEVLIMHSQCNLMLALAVCGFRITFQRLAMLIAVFLTIFCCTISNAGGLIPLAVMFSIAAIVWLVVSWWETVDRRLANTEQPSRPTLWIAAGIVVPMLVLLPSLGFGANTVTTALRGFMPSSGGTGDFDPYSRGGVKDGDALIAGNKDIKSFAPLEDAPFIDSDKPSLYDVFNDEFDEPIKKIEEQQRAVSLPPEMMMHIHQKMAEAKQAGREFSLIRSRKNSDKSPINDLDSPAMFYVAGRVPARFRMEIYEHFDGVTWYPLDGIVSKDQTQTLTPTMKQVEDRHWFSIPSRGKAFEIQEGSTTHSIKVTNLDGNVIPSPPQLIGVNIEHVDRLDLYRVSNTGIASMARKSVPQMTPINVTSEYVIRERLLDCTNLSLSSNRDAVTLFLPETDSSAELRNLAKQWTQGLPHGWQQIQAIESKLRQEYVLDRNFNIDEDSESPVNAFLLNTRRGPEYLFAASAACLLRSLGYPARVVSGFYATPDNYDARKQHTVVFAQNAHFWCEVGIGMDTWITVEPSPGYEVATPPPGLLGQLWNRILELGRLAVEHSVIVLICICVLASIYIGRRFIQDGLLTLRWKLLVLKSTGREAVWLGALVERRLKLAGLDRTSGTTLRRWAQRSVFSPVRQELTRVADLADSVLFGNEKAIDRQELKHLASVLTYRRLNRLCESKSKSSQAA